MPLVDFAVELKIATGDVGPSVTPGGFKGGGDAGLPFCGTAGQRADGFAERTRSGIGEPGAGGSRARYNAAAIAGHQGQTGGHGLERRDAERLGGLGWTKAAELA